MAARETRTLKSEVIILKDVLSMQHLIFFLDSEKGSNYFKRCIKYAALDLFLGL